MCHRPNAMPPRALPTPRSTLADACVPVLLPQPREQFAGQADLAKPTWPSRPGQADLAKPTWRCRCSMVGITEEVGVVKTPVLCEPLRVDREPPAFSAIENVAVVDIPMPHRDLAGWRGDREPPRAKQQPASQARGRHAAASARHATNTGARGRHVRDRQCGGGCGRRLVDGQDFTETTFEPPGCGYGIAACCRSRTAAGRGLAFRLRGQLPRGGDTGKTWGRPWPAPKQVTNR
jgi:hypothetical protein